MITIIMNMKKIFPKLSGIMLCFLLSCSAAYSQENLITARLMTYNIRHGAGMDDVIDLNRQADIIRRALPDVVGLQEVDSCVKRSGYIHQALVLADSLGMYSTFGGAIPLTGGKYGVAILSKQPPLSVHQLSLPGTEARTLLVCEFQDYVFATTHLDLDDSCRLASLPVIIEEAGRWDKPFFICGDWNDEPSSQFITAMKNGGFEFLNYNSDSSTFYTFPAGKPNKIIDYIASYGRVVRSIRTRRVFNEPVASDHRPVLVEIRIAANASGINSALETGAGSEEDKTFDIAGRSVSHNNLHGVYIQGGKKVLK